MTIIQKIMLFLLYKKAERLYRRITQKGGKKTMNWKTTLGAIITLVAGLCKVFGINVPEDVTTAAMTVGTFIIGLFAKDHNKL